MDPAGNALNVTVTTQGEASSTLQHLTARSAGAAMATSGCCWNCRQQGVQHCPAYPS